MCDGQSNTKSSGRVSPIMKNPRGKFVGVRQKLIIINLYKAKMIEQPNLKIKELVKIISKETGVGQNTIQVTISDHKNSRTIKTPNKTKIRLSIKEKVNDIEKNAIRQKIHNFWLKREIPSLSKILKVVNEDQDLTNFSRSNLNRLLKDLHFEYSKRGRVSGLIENDNIVIWRNRYIEQIRKYRKDGRKIYYLDETCVNVAEGPDTTVETNKEGLSKNLITGTANLQNNIGKRLIIIHIASEEGFVQGGLLSFESNKTHDFILIREKNSLDYYNEINGEIFFDWIKSVIPLLEDNSVIVMDDASYHSVEIEPSPTINWNKVDIENWLVGKESFKKPMIKVRLMEIVNRIKPQYSKYVVDEYIKENNMVVLRTPPYHCDLNPVELALSAVKKYVKTHNTTFKLPDVQKLIRDGIDSCIPEIWNGFVQSTLKEEERLWKIDFVVDDVMESINLTMMTTGDTSESDADAIM